MSRPSKQTCKKKLDKACFFCGESNYAVLDAHRILPGEQGGTYDPQNILTVCSCCHRKIHAGQITIDRKYPSTAGWVVHYWVGGEEMWVAEKLFATKS